MSLLRHSDRIGVACLAQLVNVIAPIRTEPDAPAWRQTTFYPFALTARHARGQVLRVEPVSPLLHSPSLGDVPSIDVTVTRDPETGNITIFAVNRDENEVGRLGLTLAMTGELRVAEHLVLGGGGDLHATNSTETPEHVTPQLVSNTVLTHRGVDILLPPVSWSMIRLQRAST